MGFLSRDQLPKSFDDLRQRLPEVRFRPSALLALVPVVVLGFFVLRGCDSADIPDLRAPAGVATDTTAPATSTTLPLGPVVLAGVPGTTTTTAPRSTGTASLVGSVAGPLGPVGGAAVRVEHIVGTQISTVDVTAGPDGRWELVDIPGGRYRVRAFQAPSFGQVEPALVFIPDGEERRIDLTVEDLDEFGVALAVAPTPPVPNEPLNMVVRVTRRAIGPGGSIAFEPAANVVVELLSVGTWARLTPSPSATTDANGEVSYLVTCRSPGPNQVNISVKSSPFLPGQFTMVAVPDCMVPAPVAAPTTTAGGGGTTTTGSLPPGAPVPTTSG